MLKVVDNESAQDEVDGHALVVRNGKGRTR
jgi:hypothetical protein